MKKLLAALLAAAALAGSADAQSVYVPPGNLPGGNVLSFCAVSQTTILVLGSVTCPIPFGAKWAWIESEGAATRYRGDGTAPTASVGFALPGGTATAPGYAAISSSLPQTQIIPQTGTMTLNIEFLN